MWVKQISKKWFWEHKTGDQLHTLERNTQHHISFFGGGGEGGAQQKTNMKQTFLKGVASTFGRWCLLGENQNVQSQLLC